MAEMCVLHYCFGKKIVKWTRRGGNKQLGMKIVVRKLTEETRPVRVSGIMGDSQTGIEQDAIQNRIA